MTKVEKIVQALTQEGSLIFASNLSFAEKLEKIIPNLKVEEKNDCELWIASNGWASNLALKLLQHKLISALTKAGKP